MLATWITWIWHCFPKLWNKSDPAYESLTTLTGHQDLSTPNACQERNAEPVCSTVWFWACGLVGGSWCVKLEPLCWSCSRVQRQCGKFVSPPPHINARSTSRYYHFQLNSGLAIASECPECLMDSGLAIARNLMENLYMHERRLPHHGNTKNTVYMILRKRNDHNKYILFLKYEHSSSSDMNILAVVWMLEPTKALASSFFSHWFIWL